MHRADEDLIKFDAPRLLREGGFETRPYKYQGRVRGPVGARHRLALVCCHRATQGVGVQTMTRRAIL